MNKKEITFDRFIRMAMTALLCVAVYFLLKKLSSVLMPFVVAWFVAYMMNPFVNFIQNKCHIKIRWVAILISFISFIVIIAGIGWLVIPSAIEEISKVKDIIVKYIHDNNISDFLSEYVMPYITSTEEGYRTSAP